MCALVVCFCFFFFFNDTATTEIYTLSLHDALPISSEIMLFGSFFTAYFFVRVANGVPWPTPPYQLPVFVAGINTIILVTSSFTMHWALQSIKRGNRSGLKAGLTLTFLLGLTFLLTQLLEYSRVGFAPYSDAFG